MPNNITLYDAYGHPVQKNILTQEIARPSLTGVRSIWNHGSVTSGLTPQRLATLLLNAVDGDADGYLTLAEEMEEKDLHYASVLGTRKRAVSRLPIVIEAAGDEPNDIKLADEVRALFKRRGTKGMIEEQMDALGKGYSVNEIIWDKSASPWIPARYEWRDPRFFQFDRETMRELRLKDEADLMNGLSLPAYKFMVHTPRLKCGIPLRGGLARLAAWTYIFKNFAVKDWMAFCEVFGMPLRLGKYRPGETEDNINILKGAVANLGSDAAAVIPEGMMIEFIENTKSGGGEGLFERLANWLDKQMSKAILGQTMTADDGSSQAQAKVHDEVREDIRDADAEQLAETLERDLVIPYICLNHGPQKAYPAVYLREPDQTDIPIMAEALAKLVPLGLKVEMSEVRDMLGFSDPGKDAECLTTPQPPPYKEGGGAKSPLLPFKEGVGGGGVATNSELTIPQFTPDQQALEDLAERAIEAAVVTLQQHEQLIVEAVQAASSYEDAIQRVMELYPAMNMDRLAALLESCMIGAQGFGRYALTTPQPPPYKEGGGGND
jgi:phage gp29-like protein